jgi:predicted lipoprotein with Yx(FWY)xxD motif
MTLYYYAKDAPGKSTATADIIENWPILYVSNIVLPPWLKAADFSSITRSDGKNQTTFKSWPLYYSIKDKATGDMFGQGIDGMWFIIDRQFFPPIPTTISTSIISQSR